MWLALFAGLLPLTVVPWAPDLLILFSIEPALAQRAGVFLWGIGFGLPAALVYRSLAFYSASINQARPIMVLAFVGLGINALLNWALMYGHRGLPAMRGAGCGWATGIGMWVALAALVAWTAHAPAYKPYFVWRSWTLPNRVVQRRLLRLGLPMGGAGFDGAVGRHHDPRRSRDGRRGCAGSTQSRMDRRGCGSGHRGFGDRSGHPASESGRAHLRQNGAVQALAANLLLFAAFWQLFDATQVCAMGGLRSYKVTLIPMLLTLSAFWVVGVPVGTWLAHRGFVGGPPMMVYGFWVGLVIGLMLVSLGLAMHGCRPSCHRAAGSRPISETSAAG
jgi:MATE family multidrug resistance protein